MFSFKVNRIPSPLFELSNNCCQPRRKPSTTEIKHLRPGMGAKLCSPRTQSLISGRRLLFSMYTVGQLTGSIYSGQIADRFGRRAGMFVGCLIVLIGTAVVSSSNDQHQFVAGMFAVTPPSYPLQAHIFSSRPLHIGNGCRHHYYRCTSICYRSKFPGMGNLSLPNPSMAGISASMARTHDGFVQYVRCTIS